jgi:hypothetical protein
MLMQPYTVPFHLMLGWHWCDARWRQLALEQLLQCWSQLQVLRLSAAISVQGLGACLTQANLEDIKRFIEDFAVRSLLPAMEARVRALNHWVSIWKINFADDIFSQTLQAFVL